MFSYCATFVSYIFLSNRGMTHGYPASVVWICNALDECMGRHMWERLCRYARVQAERRKYGTRGVMTLRRRLIHWSRRRRQTAMRDGVRQQRRRTARGYNERRAAACAMWHQERWLSCKHRMLMAKRDRKRCIGEAGCVRRSSSEFVVDLAECVAVSCSSRYRLSLHCPTQR